MSTGNHDGLDDLLDSESLPPELATTAADVVARAGNTAEARESMRHTLDAYLRHPEWEAEFERALTSKQQLRDVSATAADLISRGADPDQLKAWLNAFHLHLMSQDREQDDDVVLEALDELVGF